MREALRADRRRLFRLWIREGPERDDHAQLRELAQALGVPIESVSPAALTSRVGEEGNHQGVALEAGPIPELDLKSLLARIASEPGGVGQRLLALDGVEDPQNVGAVARVAESAGVGGMVLTERRAPELTPAVSRASAGAIEWLPVARVSNLGRALAELADAGFWSLAAAPSEGADLYSVEDRILAGNLVVVLGAEGKGIRPSILDQCDHRMAIPMRGRIDSLNVSTAGAVILFELLRRGEAALREPHGA